MENAEKKRKLNGDLDQTRNEYKLGTRKSDVSISCHVPAHECAVLRLSGELVTPSGLSADQGGGQRTPETLLVAIVSRAAPC